MPPKRQERPYHDDSTASRLLSEVKHHRAWLVLRWGTTLESQVLFFLLRLPILGHLRCRFEYPMCARAPPLFFFPPDANMERPGNYAQEGLRAIQTPHPLPPLLQPQKGPSFHKTPMNFFDLPIFAPVYWYVGRVFGAHNQQKTWSRPMRAPKKTGTTIP